MSEYEALRISISAMGDPVFVPIPLPTVEHARTLDEKQPKIVDERKYRGPGITDFETIRRRMKELGND